jgi:hypothetical protein
VEGTIGEVKAAVDAFQTVGDAKQAATAEPQATYAEEEIEGRLGFSSYMLAPERHWSASTLASSTAARANPEKAKLKPEAAAAPQRKAETAGELASPVEAAQIAGDAKQVAEHRAANPAAFATAIGTAAAGAGGSFPSANWSSGFSKLSNGFSAATKSEVRAGHLG